ncbi:MULTISPECIES: type II toxin-antitoxin system VapB family antitoxin [unclassified Ensifer]|uniref:type II toxin-antitoxin system VapB family antitoxin n=1 Tax=unclassified Ensifer TaxID=2633371 RepID=UPI0008136CDF|nr:MULTISPECIES: type II toxin-antitoxin system VapB family antitoxin [unclassified Ensifer]OCP18234.1 transcription factor [Ensifer sp. LC54]OCP27593.1 transcription factor [Ensifer sp. LC384]
MSEPQLSIRSAKAKELAHALARRTGMPMSKLVERALERYDSELRQQKNQHPLDAVWDMAEHGRSNVPTDTTSAHDDLYDEDGLPV